MNRTIWIAAGHATPGDPGALGQGTNEAAQSVDIANRLAAKLKSDGRLKPIVVPHALNLKAEIGWINARATGLEDGYCVEIHKNQAANSATGVEAWFRDGSETGRKLAAIVLAELSAVTRLRNRGVKPDTTSRHKSLGWVRQTRPHAGLFECGFIRTDPLRNDLYAEGMFRGLLAMHGLRDEVPDLYRVVRRSGRQLGAYRVRSNAWKAFLSVHGDAVILNRERVDVTAEFVGEFGRAGIRAEDVEELRLAPSTGEPADIDHDDEPVSERLRPAHVELLPERDTQEIVPRAA